MLLTDISSLRTIEDCVFRAAVVSEAMAGDSRFVSFAFTFPETDVVDVLDIIFTCSCFGLTCETVVENVPLLLLSSVIVFLLDLVVVGYIATVLSMLLFLMTVGIIFDEFCRLCPSCCLRRSNSSSCCNKRSFSFEFIVIDSVVSPLIDSIFRFKCFGLLMAFFFIGAAAALVSLPR